MSGYPVARTAMVFSLCLLAAAFAPSLAAERRDFDIPAAPAAYSVRQFARQAGLSVMFEAEKLKRFRTRALKGNFDTLEALAALLEGSGLEFSISAGVVISVEPISVEPQPVGVQGPVAPKLPVVEIQGWKSRGNSASPAGVSVQRVTADELAKAGYATIADWARSLPQNEGSGASEDTHNFLREAPTNTAYGSGMNLYGIGSRATLILVNGRRLAPSGSAGTFTDISNIPISAIDHIDVISGSAAALYGADAVGGVVDFVLQGGRSAMVSNVMIGHLTRGSLGERGISQSVPGEWGGGGGVLSLEYYSRGELPASDRSQAMGALTPLGAAAWLLPHQERLSVLGSSTFQVSDESSVFFDALWNRRWVQMQQESLGDPGESIFDGRVDSGQFAWGLNRELSLGWNVRAYVGYTFESQRNVEHGLTDGWVDLDSAFRYGGVSAMGSVPFFPAGPLRLTFGSDCRAQSFRTAFSPSVGSAYLIPTPATDRDRTVSAVFVQGTTPMLGPGTHWPLRLDFSAGVRYEHFSDVGQGVMPTFGFEFSPHPAVTLKGTWARLFRAPDLPDLNESANSSEIFTLPDANSPLRSVRALVVSGNNSGLRPETSHSWRLGVTFAPATNPNLTFSGSYFNIVSSNRIVALTPMPLSVLADPRYSYVVGRSVSLAEREEVCNHSRFVGEQSRCLDSDVAAIVDLRLRNTERLEVDGLDLSGRYGRDTFFGVVDGNIAATYFLHYREAQMPAGPLVEYRNTDHNPPALRLRGLFSWERHGLWVSPAINFQSGYVDIDNLPQRPVSSWMTWDVVTGYRASSFDSALGGETMVSLRGQNVFNKQPPFLRNGLSGVGYDPENGDLLGRRVSVALQHRW
ncbi:MAG: TonB-dependent receptor domain-containing protein [Steroidobacteraceae bacterium]